MSNSLPNPKPNPMWLILVGVAIVTVVEAVKLEKRPGLKFQKVRHNSPDPASSLNRRV